MKTTQIEHLRNCSRKLVRELGMLQLDNSNEQETPGHWHALVEIAKEPGITISALGHMLLLSKSSISRLIKNLGNADFIDTKSGPDKREKYLFLTEKGTKEVKKIDLFSKEKILGAFEFLKHEDIDHIIQSIALYSEALEKSRLMREQVKIATVSTSRTLRKQIIAMIQHIQRNEFHIPVTDEMNECILKAEAHFYYNNSYNFWYATDDNGQVIGSIGLKKINDSTAEIKKFFVVERYRGKGIAQKLMKTAVEKAQKHSFTSLILGTVDALKRAQKFYANYGFYAICEKELPKEYEKCPLDTVFFKAKIQDIHTD